ncbi:hypothetical protein K0817_009315 [Microbacterium sp. HD4P20]|uniref:hypothetical protein n=1 Tax=Microbacterium sp. HD4P20 TaxID=2864874 RepID=UPI001C63D5AC|nr:hypothetical protein [Microbacterium sp. HD4P20]MCP2636762.1 hypothetical protein [Microbacterium sp. HD4P20]
MNRAATIQRLRETLSARDERERALPRAKCRVCGGWARKGEGERTREPEFADARDKADHAYWLSRQPGDVDGWRRTCAMCARAEAEKRAASTILLAVVGSHDLKEHEASRVIGVLRNRDPDGPGFVGGVTAEANGRATGTPWDHVSDADRGRLREAWATLIAARSPRPSQWGGCGMCGRAEAVGDWWRAPDTLRWPDGSRTAFCAACAAVWDRRGGPSHIDDLRRVGVEAATGWPVPLGNSAPPLFRLFAESRSADPAGLTESWSWSDGLRQYIEEVWTRHPAYAPEHRREGFEQRRRVEFAAMTAEASSEKIRQEAATW